MRLVLLLLLALSAYGCAAPRAALGPRPEAFAVTSMTSAVADQVKPCYRSPRVPSVGRRIITRLRVRFSPDGTLAEPPQLVYQQGVTAENSPYAAAMAEAARAAVFRCSPLHLPQELHRGGWDSLDLTFSPRVLV